MPSIRDLIASLSGQLTPTERRIAEVVLEDPTRIAFGSVSDLAGQTGASRPSIVRFASKLGFEGYTDLQSWIREGVSRELSRPAERIRQQDAPPIRHEIEESVHRAFEAFGDGRLAAMARPIAEARRVWIASGESSLAGAHALQGGLSMVRSDVHLIEQHVAFRHLSGAEPADVAVIIDFARYRRSSITAARTLADLGVPIIAITDGPLSPLAALTSNWCELRIPAVGPFDSSIPVVTAAELLVAEVSTILGDRARERLDRLESLWQASGTFV